MSISEWPSFWARYTPDAPVFVFEGETETWAQFESRIACLAGGLRSAGVAYGGRIGALVRNTPMFFELIMAAARCGAVVVPLNTRLTAPELRHIAEHADLQLLLTDASFADVLGQLEHVVAAGATYFVGAPPAGGRPAEDLLKSSPLHEATGVRDDDTVLICYTSGTTGLPKGACLTHRNVATVTDGLRCADDIRRGDRVAVSVPVAFTGSAVTTSMPFLHSGASILLEHELDPARLIEHVEQDRVTYIAAVPIVFELMLQTPGFDGKGLAGLRVAKSGGAPVPEALIEAYQALGIDMTQGYGITEGAAFSLQLPAVDARRKVGFTGLPALHQRCRVVDDAGADVPDGEVGELLISGPNVMAGYWRDPEATDEACVDGWLHTGDLALRDEDGYYKIVDRKKDMLVSGGLNVYPAEIERVLAGHPDVQEVAVIARPDRKWGEVPVACVVSSKGDLSLEQLVRYASASLADYKRPRELVLLDALPRNMSGKVVKPRLREQVLPRLSAS
jgi:fatty-acyl-CoA synthase